MICECFRQSYYNDGIHPYCIGTKECDNCTCGGDESKCDFYPEKRTKPIINKKIMTEKKSAILEYSIIIWNRNCEIAPTGIPLLVVVNDDGGDNPYTYITTAWCTEKGYNWICDNDYVFGEVIAWAKLPEPGKIGSINNEIN